jgi:hypothetical protein
MGLEIRCIILEDASVRDIEGSVQNSPGRIAAGHVMFKYLLVCTLCTTRPY